ncbi:50S ribosomal protein L35 [Sulfobacillus thermosulfidooxidans]|uniref:Large ribosomal subunit protein bL35 n=2 Tax=Sulfobacillus thermosulfidooxidans TaxID=28034 RepID=A0A1W1W5T1_SULTA|nr:50S ribosomal protein L35 [Sulfobacillus thermosulfidooxidans]OLZ09829.1 50S ribosomal protein L35 [Sulfobacillus thermosulfidooxidans]OLZ15865.1 50S ribosomal protein L35 [Sulfobacillus thermosulfidooxidans]OLZ18288.1 50S ribosomal protein L35 [Sulfobacillus thermosulfidooxidans]PSR25641.1 MAG: 50S ribosomal protein L35 [Sulfobacillus thermosulfidooxidans]SMC01644.1 large subunit ribosomal protein L35 [Sulfobacillus thermosulfidooxidans DSM 9293]
MPKMKTHRGAAKRLKVTGNGKVARYHAGKSHLLEHKSPTRRRRLRQDVLLSHADYHRAKRLLPNGR